MVQQHFGSEAMSYNIDPDPSHQLKVKQRNVDVVSAVRDTRFHIRGILDLLSTFNRDARYLADHVNNRVNHALRIVYALGVLTVINCLMLGVIIYNLE
jgi:hypothetical protein